MMVKLNFQQLLLQSSVSHDPSEIIWTRNIYYYYYYYQCWKLFLWKLWFFFNRNFKTTAFIWKKKNYVFTVTFDQMYFSLFYKIINLF